MNVKAGDLAIVAWTSSESMNLGRLVKVLRPMADDMPGFKFQPNAWVVESLGAPLVSYSVLDNSIVDYLMIRPMGDVCLRPISGLPNTEDTDQEIKEPA